MIVAGFGFRDAADENSFRDALKATGVKPDRLATAAPKTDHPAFRAFAETLDLDVLAIPLSDLALQQVSTQSNMSEAKYGTGSVAEASALAAAGPGARLVGVRQVSHDRRATCAIARGETT